MNHARVKNFIEVASNIAVVVTALIVVGSFARSYFRRVRESCFRGWVAEGSAASSVLRIRLQ